MWLANKPSNKFCMDAANVLTKGISQNFVVILEHAPPSLSISCHLSDTFPDVKAQLFVSPFWTVTHSEGIDVRIDYNLYIRIGSYLKP